MTNLLATTLLLGSIGVNNGLCQSTSGTTETTYLEKGQAAPYTGILFTERKAGELRSDLLELDKQRLLLETEKNRTERLGHIIKLKDEEIELFQKQNTRLLNANDRSGNMQYIWFGLGIVVTGMAVYGAGALSR
jgi:hypothetical protein